MVGNTVRIAPLLSKYRLQVGPTNSILVSQASQLASIQQLTVTGTLLKNQIVQLDLRTGRRRVAVAKGGGHYSILNEGSLRVCLGVRQLQPHIVCRIPGGADWQWLFNQAVGERITVSGILRCSFAEAGFQRDHDAHIFEIHPVQAVNLAGELHGLEIPKPDLAEQWTTGLSVRDAQIKVQYWKGSDILVFRNVEGQDPDYVRLVGRLLNKVLIGSRNRMGRLTVTNAEVNRRTHVFCLPGTRAARQLRALKSSEVSIVGLRSIDIREALRDRFVVNLVAIDIQPA